MKSASPINISPHEDDESEEDNDDAADEGVEATPEAFEQSKAVEANDDKGDSVVNDDDKLA